jgi:hypothetical protein
MKEDRTKQVVGKKTAGKNVVGAKEVSGRG